MTVTPLETLLSRTSSSKYTNGEYRCSCPGPLHTRGDRNPSLSAKECEDGSIVLYCFAGCSTYEVVSAIGLTMKDLYPQTRRPAVGPNYKFLYESIKDELIVLAIAASQIEMGKELSEEDLSRLKKTAMRLAGLSL